MNDTYTCSCCGVELSWDGGDDSQGSIWECEGCKTHFICEACQFKLDGKHATADSYYEPVCTHCRVSPKTVKGISVNILKLIPAMDDGYTFEAEVLLDGEVQGTWTGKSNGYTEDNDIGTYCGNFVKVQAACDAFNEARNSNGFRSIFDLDGLLHSICWASTFTDTNGVPVGVNLEGHAVYTQS